MQYFWNGIGGRRVCAGTFFPAALVAEVGRYPELGSVARNFDLGLPTEIRVRIDVRFFVDPNVRRLPPNWLSRFPVENLDSDGDGSCFLRGESKRATKEQHRYR